MKFPTFHGLLSHRVVSSSLLVGMSLCGLSLSAQASNLLRGSDYLSTPNDGSTSFDFGSLGIVKFKGVPLQGLEGADTIIERLADAIFDTNNDGFLETQQVTIPIRLSALSLVSSSPVLIQDEYFNVTPKLNAKPSEGTMTIRHNATKTRSGQYVFNDGGIYQGTFSSEFAVNFDAHFNSDSGKSFVIPDQSIILLNSGADWSHGAPGTTTFLKRGMVGDLAANCHNTSGACRPGDFFPGPVQHAKGSPNYPNGHGTTLAQIINPPICGPVVIAAPGSTGVISSAKPVCTVTSVAVAPIAMSAMEVPFVQGAPMQTPGPLPIFGAAVSMSFCRRLRQRTRAAQMSNV